MHIPEEKIHEIRERADIVSVIGRRVALKKAGRSYKGLCPFHGEKTPSFHVNPEKKIFHCFGCSKGGDVFRFLMEIEGRAFPEVVQELAEETGVFLEDTNDPQAARLLAERRALAEVNARALAVFERFLWGPKGRAGRAHLAERGISEETARAFRLGWAPAAWNELGNALQAEGVELRLLIQAGLVVPKEQGRPYDRFRGRLMVPILGTDGRVLAFGGRHVEDMPDKRSDQHKPAKYINSPDTLLYEKGRVLFALDKAREAVRASQKAILVEGYFDAIALHQAGVKSAVASCGTALTGAHLDALRRTGARDVVLLFDGDEAGLRAAGRAAQMAGEAHMSAKVALLPKGHDPDTFVRRAGAEAVTKLVDEAPAALEYLIDRALDGVGRSVEDKARAIEAVKPILAWAPPGVSRDLYVEKVARRLGVSERTVAGALHGEKRSGLARSASVPPPPGGPARSVPLPPHDEVYVAALVLHAPEVAPVAAARAEAFSNASLRALVERAARAVREGARVDAANQGLVEEEDTQKLLRKVLMDEGSFPADKDPRDLLKAPLRRIEKNALVRRQRALQQAMREAEAAGADCRALLEEAARLSAEKKRLAGENPGKL